MDWKRIGKRLLFPPVWLIAVLVLLSAAALITVFWKKWDTSLAACIVYVLSFYSLCVLTAWCVTVLPGQYRRVKRAIYENPLGYRYMTDRIIRTKTSLHISLTINMLYAGINLWSWYLLRSWWFMVLAVYYVIMAVMRFLLVRYVRIQKIGTSLLGEWKRSRSCACILLLINLSLSGTVLMILHNNRGFDYPGMMIYVMALYTFYSTIHAIAELVKYRNLGSPVMSTAKIVSLSAALVSMLNLETAMFAQFGAEMSAENQRTFIILTGVGVSMTVVTLSVLLIVRATKEIRRMKHGRE
ncbi:MAG: hypothetical protein PUD38_05840 [Firmicutes bacterium]|nr:hypothetical protein [Bacillota bacterium]